jgi:hypothetical protein
MARSWKLLAGLAVAGPVTAAPHADPPPAPYVDPSRLVLMEHSRGGLAVSCASLGATDRLATMLAHGADRLLAAAAGLARRAILIATAGHQFRGSGIAFEAVILRWLEPFDKAPSK